jgi:uronate dehydrogenase
MNLNVCEAARAGGARRIVFASSIHACTGSRGPGQAAAASELPYLPLDGGMPPHCDEAYGLSKISGEQVLRFYAHQHGLTTVALRFSRLTHTPPPAEGWPVEKHLWLDEAFTWLTFADAARCIAAALVAPIAGYHCYLPASPRPWAAAPVEELRRKYYPTVPLKSPAPLHSLVDLTALARDLNWSPQDS